MRCFAARWRSTRNNRQPHALYFKSKRPSPARPSSSADLVCARDEKEVQDAVLQYLQGVSMKRTTLFAAGVVALLTSLVSASPAQSDGPYKVLTTSSAGDVRV